MEILKKIRILILRYNEGNSRGISKKFSQISHRIFENIPLNSHGSCKDFQRISKIPGGISAEITSNFFKIFGFFSKIPAEISAKLPDTISAENSVKFA